MSPDAAPALPVLAAVVGAGVLAGVSIGAVGVGGVLLTPLLLALTPYGVTAIMPAAAFSFLFTGVIGGLAYARRGSVRWRDAGWLTAGVVPAAVAGALTNARSEPGLLLGALALLLLVAALQGVWRPAGGPPPRRRIPTALLIGMGLLVGFGSALTGTGGPVLLVPLLLLARTAPLAAVGTAQLIQLPLAASATAGFLALGQLDLVLGLILGASQAGAVLVGAGIAHGLPTARLRRVVSAALLVAAVALALRVVAPG